MDCGGRNQKHWGQWGGGFCSDHYWENLVKLQKENFQSLWPLKTGFPGVKLEGFHVEPPAIQLWFDFLTFLAPMNIFCSCKLEDYVLYIFFNFWLLICLLTSKTTWFAVCHRWWFSLLLLYFLIGQSCNFQTSYISRQNWDLSLSLNCYIWNC